MSDAVPTLDNIPSTGFVLHGCREVVATSAGAVSIERQIIVLEEAVNKNPGLAFDLAKTLVETTCKTILTDRGHTYEKDWDVPKLLKETTTKLQLLPNSHNTDTRLSEAFKRTLSGFVNIVVGLSEIRNAGGFASHGKDAYEQPIEDTTQALFVARAADAVVHFLFRVHRSYTGAFVRQPSLAYQDNPDYNAYIDENNPPVTIFDLTYQPSDVLFSIDNQAYRDQLNEYKNIQAGGEAG